MLSTDKLESQKIAKYAYRLNKSFRNLNLIKSNEYLLHLKHYIQKGGNHYLSEQVAIMNKISETINNPENKDKYNIPTIKANCAKKIQELEKKITDLQKELNNTIDDHGRLTAVNLQNVTGSDNLKKVIDELTENIKKMEEEINTLNEKLINLLADETLSEEDKKDKNKLLYKIGEKIKNCNNYKEKSEELPILLKELADEKDKVRKLDEKIEENDKFNTKLATNLSQLLLQLLTGFLGEEDATNFINGSDIVKVVEETPKVEAPKEEAPKVEAKEEAPKVEQNKIHNKEDAIQMMRNNFNEIKFDNLPKNLKEIDIETKQTGGIKDIVLDGNDSGKVKYGICCSNIKFNRDYYANLTEFRFSNKKFNDIKESLIKDTNYDAVLRNIINRKLTNKLLMDNNNSYKIYQLEKKTNLSDEMMEENVDKEIPSIMIEVLNGLKKQLQNELKDVENEFMVGRPV